MRKYIKNSFIKTIDKHIDRRKKKEEIDKTINSLLEFDDFRCYLFSNLHYEFENELFEAIAMHFCERDEVLDWIYYLIYESDSNGYAVVDEKKYPITNATELWDFLEEIDYELVCEMKEG